jgi:TatD DNase family protein
VAGGCLDGGGNLWFSGIVTLGSADDVGGAAAGCPLDGVLVETDCPYLTPTPHRGKRNEPAYVTLTAAHVAALRGTDPEAFGESVTANAARLFKIALP